MFNTYDASVVGSTTLHIQYYRTTTISHQGIMTFGADRGLLCCDVVGYQHQAGTC